MLVRPDDGGFYLLDELGTLIWELCDGERSVDEVIERVARAREATAAATAGDVVEWVAELLTEGLLVDGVSGDPPPDP